MCKKSDNVVVCHVCGSDDALDLSECRVCGDVVCSMCLNKDTGVCTICEHYEDVAEGFDEDSELYNDDENDLRDVPVNDDVER